MYATLQLWNEVNSYSEGKGKEREIHPGLRLERGEQGWGVERGRFLKVIMIVQIVLRCIGVASFLAARSTAGFGIQCRNDRTKCERTQEERGERPLDHPMVRRILPTLFVSAECTDLHTASRPLSCCCRSSFDASALSSTNSRVPFSRRRRWSPYLRWRSLPPIFSLSSIPQTMQPISSLGCERS